VSITGRLCPKLRKQGVQKAILAYVGERAGWKKIRNKELHDLYATPNIIPVMKLRTGHEALWEEDTCRGTKYFVGET
jgi:hypothetical protein